MYMAKLVVKIINKLFNCFCFFITIIFNLNFEIFNMFLNQYRLTKKLSLNSSTDCFIVYVSLLQSFLILPILSLMLSINISLSRCLESACSFMIVLILFSRTLISSTGLLFFLCNLSSSNAFISLTISSLSIFNLLSRIVIDSFDLFSISAILLSSCLYFPIDDTVRLSLLIFCINIFYKRINLFTKFCKSV